MSILLVTLKGNKLFNRTIFSPWLYIYDDLLIYKKRKWFVLREMTISYKQIARFTLAKRIFFAHINIISTGGDKIEIKFVNKKNASQAKAVIDQKIFHSHARRNAPINGSGENVGSYEKTINRLKELRNRNKISEREYEKKKRELLKKL